jgi:DNA-binding NarL/FixJ family response regulator
LATNRGWPANNSFDFAADLPRIQDFCRPSRSWIRQRNLWRLAFLLYCRWFYPILDLSTLICTWSFCTAGIRNGLTNWQRPAIVLLAVKYKRERRLLSSIRILVVDDHEGWRREVCQLLQVRPEFQVIGEASDGSEAVLKTDALRPDLIVLDIGLPKLNGIEAARRIRQLPSSSKIVFLSLYNSPDVVQAALSTGALGYVRKTDAQSELLLAVDAALRGKKFVSSSIKGFESTDTAGAKAPHRHELLMFSDDTVLLDSFTRFIAAALKADNAAIALVTKSHQESLRQRLKAEGVDTDDAIQQGTFILLDVADTLATLLVDGSPDPVRFLEDFSGLIKEAAKAAKAEQPRVAFCGECLGRLWAEGKTDAAIRLEQVCDELIKTHEVDILCAYPLRSFHDEEDEHIFQSICAEHSAVYAQ